MLQKRICPKIRLVNLYVFLRGRWFFEADQEKMDYHFMSGGGVSCGYILSSGGQ